MQFKNESWQNKNDPSSKIFKFWSVGQQGKIHKFTLIQSFILYSSDVLRDILDMDPDLMSKDPDFAEWVSGNKVLDGSFPMAHRYGGHQFGSWVSIFYSSQVEEKGPRSEKTRSKLFNCETNF